MFIVPLQHTMTELYFDGWQSGLNITVSHWPFSEHVQETTGYTWHLPVKMAGRKRTSILVVVLSLIIPSLRRKTGARLLLGPWKDGKGNTMLPMRV